MANRQNTLSSDTLIEDIVQRYPGLVRPLRELGIACIRCGEPIWGTLEQAAKEKDLDIDAIVKSLNRILASEKT